MTFRDTGEETGDGLMPATFCSFFAICFHANRPLCYVSPCVAYIHLMNQYYPVQDSFDFKGEANSQAAEDLQCIAQDATAAGMTIGEYFEAHPEKRPDWLSRIYYGEYAKQYGMPITQEDTWALDTLRPEEENLAAINELLAENGLPPLKSVDWSVVADALLANITENGIMKLYEPGQPLWSGESDLSESPDEPAMRDFLNAVLTHEQLAGLAEIDNDVRRLLTDEQRQRIDAGENIYVIISELDPINQALINQLSQNVRKKLGPQLTDLLFLSSGLLYGEDLDTRLAILQRIKDKEGIITYEDLVEIGVYADGESKSWGQEYADLLEYGYQKNCEGTSLDELDRQYRAQQQMQMTMMVAMAAAPLLDWVFNGPSNISLDPKRHLEGIELEGWNIKGPPSYSVPREVEGETSDPAAGTGEEVIYNANGDLTLRSQRRPAFDGMMNDGFEIDGNQYILNEHAYNSLFKSGRKDIMPADIYDALKVQPVPGNAGSVEYVNPTTGTSVFVNPATNEIVGIWPAGFLK